MDWEDWLRTAVQPPSNNEDEKRERTESQITKALAAHSPLAGRPYRIYAKGSYSNNTNVRLNYDVDVAVEYTGFFYYDLCFALKGHDKSEVGVVAANDPYTRSEFQTDILDALNQAYGKDSVETGNIAYRIRHDKTTLPADVVPCWEYRRYDGIDYKGDPIFHTGSRVFPATGDSKDNYPKIQNVNGTAKNNATGRRYKRMVRAYKKLQTRMVTEGRIAKELPSYLTESLVYNVPNSDFGASEYLADMREVLATIYNATLSDEACSEWLHVHELNYLLRRSSDFSRADVHAVTSAAWDYLGLD